MKSWLCLILLACATLHCYVEDSRYRLYGSQLDPNVLANTSSSSFPTYSHTFRTRSGGSGYSAKSDIICVGNIENIGPLATMSEGEVIENWSGVVVDIIYQTAYPPVDIKVHTGNPDLVKQHQQAYM